MEEAIALIKASQEICAQAGLKLHKIMSKKNNFLQAFPVEERAKGIRDVDLEVDPLVCRGKHFPIPHWAARSPLQKTWYTGHSEFDLRPPWLCEPSDTQREADSPANVQEQARLG